MILPEEPRRDLESAIAGVLRYMIFLRRRGGRYFSDALLPGIVPPRTLALMEVRAVDELGLCKSCDFGSHCHVLVQIAQHTFAKLCPILFQDVVRPRWRLEDVV